MPELPEVETVARGLDRPLSGERIVRARAARRDVYRRGSLPLTRLVGSRITGVARVGKAIVVRTVAPAPGLAVHLGMTGTLRLESGAHRPRRHRHAVLSLDGGLRLEFVDPRRFGYLWVGPLDDIGGRLGIGPDPFQIGAATLRRRLAARRAPIKSLLLVQSLVSGLGNIYADETLFYARVHPLTPGAAAAGAAGRLLEAARTVLRRAIERGGTTIRDFRAADGSEGGFGEELAAYGRAGRPCPRCGAAIERTVIGTRSSHYCPRCQRR